MNTHVSPAFAGQSDIALSEFGRAALQYAGIGWLVFPLWPGTKNPITPNGHLAASSDPATVAGWWQQHPAANIGISLAASGLVAVDPDTYKPGCEWDSFKAGHAVPDTLTQRTARGGQHLIFAAPPGASYASKLCEGVDVKHNGYIVAAPSLFEGGAYQWEGGTMQPAPAPAWLPTGAQGIRKPLGQGAQAPSFKAALDALHNIDPNQLDFDGWLAVTFAFRGATAGLATEQEARAAWEAWCTSYEKNDLADNRKLWKSADGGTNKDWISLHWESYGQPPQADPAAMFGALPPQYALPPGASLQPIQPAGAAVQAEFFLASDFAGQPVPPREWLVPDLIPMSNVTLLGGDGGTGKSLLAMQLAAGVAAGRAWLDAMPRNGRALYLSAEDDRNELHRRLNDICRSMCMDLADLSRLTILPLAGEDALLAHEQKGAGLHPTQLFQMVESRVATERPALVVLDTLADLFPANENDRALVRQFVGLLRGLAIRHACAVVLLSHPSLTGMSTGTGASGSTAWNNSVRSRLYLERIKGDNGRELDPDARVLTTKKSNYGRTGNEIRMTWRNGVFVREIGAPDAETGEKAKQVFLDLLEKLTVQGRNVNANGGPTYAPSVFSKEVDADGITKAAFARAMSALLEDGKIRNVAGKRSTRLELVRDP